MDTATDTTPTAGARLTARVNATPLPALAEALLMLDAEPSPDEAKRRVRAAVIDSICERCPAAETAFDAWANSDDADPRTAVRAMAAAAKAA